MGGRACVCVRACVHACVRACVCVCVRDNNINNYCRFVFFPYEFCLRVCVCVCVSVCLSPLADVAVGDGVDRPAVHVAGETALGLGGHRLVERHVEATEPGVLLRVAHQRGRLPRACRERPQRTHTHTS